MFWRVIVIGIPVVAAFGASVSAFTRERTSAALVQLVGASCLLVVIFIHIFEALNLFPTMGWGRPDTRGHYIDLASAIIGVTLLAGGYFSRRLVRRWR